MTTAAEEHQEVVLEGIREEFRTALREELEAARRSSASGAIQLVNGRRIAQIGSGFQYLFLVESALNAPDDSPGDLYIAGRKPVETVIISVEGLAVTLSVPVDLGDFVPRAALQSDLTHLLRKLIERIEQLASAENPAGERLLGDADPQGEPARVDSNGLNPEQTAAVASALGRDTTFIWGPPGTGKTRTIGRIGAELVRRERALLLVSHTNAAVDLAVLMIADDLGADLRDGSVLRLGDSKEQALLERPRLLAQTHIEERSAALVAERDSLGVERGELAARVLELQRLLGIWEWLPIAAADIAQAKSDLAELEILERGQAQAEAALEPLEREAKVWLPKAEQAREAVQRQARLEDVRREVARGERDLDAVDARLTQATPVRREADDLLRHCKEHRPKVDAANARLPELRLDLAQSRSVEEAAAAGLERVTLVLREATDLLTLTNESSGLVRRWKGLPKPEDQESVVAHARAEHDAAQAEHEQCAQRRQALADEQAQLENAVEKFGHLPLLAEQELVTARAKREEEDARTARNREWERLGKARSEMRSLGEPRVVFAEEHGQDPREVIDAAAALEQQLGEARERVADSREQARRARHELESSLIGRVRALREWQLSDLRHGTAEELLEEVERALQRGRDIVAGTSVDGLRAESREANGRIRAIDIRLEEIDDELQRVEEIVIGEALVVATTLTRAYKRESVQKRRFDTVVLDEASMAPIPALWVAASLADANVILVGDFRQLPPIKHSDHELAKWWLGRDVFDASGLKAAYERHEAPAHFVQLQEQFRMHPAISAIPNHFFYGGTLRDEPGVERDDRLDGWYQRDWGSDSPVLLVDTGSLNAWVTAVNNAGRTSRLNFLSATVCVDLAEMMLRVERPEPDDGHARILIGAPYRPQAKLINLLIRENKLDREVRAGTVHTFQGSEAPVMIFDLVNDEPHWKVAMFMQSRSEDFKRLLNVALTRAQRRLIIVGDFDYVAKQGKKAFIGELIDFLRDRYPVVEAAKILPAGLSARAARMQTQAQGDEVEADRLVVTQDAYDHHLIPDLAAARERVVIYSPFMTYERVAALQPQLRAAADRGVAVWVVTKERKERGRQVDTYREIERALSEWGCRIVHKARMHEKIVFVDEDILWQGSLNTLSFSDTQEVMERRRSTAVVEDYAHTLRLAELLSAHEEHQAGEGACPFCGGEIVAAEGRDDPFYWRCVADACFSRSIGDPMPKDGMVVCASAGCGLPVHYGEWGGVPHWRCEANHRHRTKIARSHVRLPKMRAIVPPRELKKLDRQFGLNGGQPALQTDAQLELL